MLSFMNTKRSGNIRYLRVNFDGINLAGKVRQTKKSNLYQMCIDIKMDYTGGESNPRPTGCKPVVITN
jgi:hypothetical protein